MIHIIFVQIKIIYYKCTIFFIFLDKKKIINEVKTPQKITRALKKSEVVVGSNEEIYF